MQPTDLSAALPTTNADALGRTRYPGVDALPVFDTYMDLERAVAEGATANDFQNVAGFRTDAQGNDIINLVADLANTGAPQE